MTKITYTIYRVTEDGEWSLSGNLTAERASVERDRLNQEIPAHARYWIEVRLG
jgi:hypothetical protein